MRILRLVLLTVFFGIVAVACDSKDKQDSAEIEDTSAYSYDFGSASGKIRLEFEDSTIDPGKDVKLQLRFVGFSDPVSDAKVVLVSPATKRAEVISMQVSGTNALLGYARVTHIEADDTESTDGVLWVEPGAPVQAHFYVPDDSRFVAVEEKLVVATAVVRGASDAAEARVILDTSIIDHFDPSTGEVEAGVLIDEKYGYTVLDTQHLIFMPIDEDNFNQFFEVTQARTLEATHQGRSIEPNVYYEGGYYLVDVSDYASRFSQSDLINFRNLLGEKNTLRVSHERLQQNIAAVLGLRLQGFLTAVNPALNPLGELQLDGNEDGSSSRQLFPQNCIPNATRLDGKDCLLNVPAVWAYNAITGIRYADSLNLAVIDSGFKVTSDYRKSKPDVECDATVKLIGANTISCDDGSAQSVPEAINSSLSRSWHGNGVVSSATARLDNNAGGSGVAAQIGNPHLYRTNMLGYVFGLQHSIDAAIENNAACINISAGYPCRLLTNIGPDFNICSKSGRSEFCVAIGLVTVASTAVVCSIAPLIPFGEIACAASSTATTVASEACLRQLALGKISGPLQDAVRRAYLKGIPVVASAGNKGVADALPAPIRDYVNFDSYSLDEWKVVPAIFPQTIAVGAVDSRTFNNRHFIGDSVDIWAPIGSKYLAPESVDDFYSPLKTEYFGGTSDAAPFVSGVILNIMANDYSLQPANLTFDNSSQYGDDNTTGPNNVERIRALLKDTAFLPHEVAQLSPRGSDQEARQIVNPLGAVLTVDPKPIERFKRLGYPIDFGFGQKNPASRELFKDVPQFGTVVNVSSPPKNIDNYKIAIPAYQPDGQNLYRISLTGKIPYDSDHPEFDSIDGNMFRKSIFNTGDEQHTWEISFYTLQKGTAEDLSYHDFHVTGNGLYKIVLDEVAPRDIGFEVNRPLQGKACLGYPLRMSASAYSSEGERLPDDFLNWRAYIHDKDGAAIAQTLTVNERSMIVTPDRAGLLVIDVFAGDYRESAEYEIVDCVESHQSIPSVWLSDARDDPSVYAGEDAYLTYDCDATGVKVSLNIDTRGVKWEHLSDDESYRDHTLGDSALTRVSGLTLLYREMGTDNWAQIHFTEPDIISSEITASVTLPIAVDANRDCQRETHFIKARIRNVQGLEGDSPAVRVIATRLL